MAALFTMSVPPEVVPIERWYPSALVTSSQSSVFADKEIPLAPLAGSGLVAFPSSVVKELTLLQLLYPPVPQLDRTYQS